MGGGKSSALLQVVHNYKSKGMNVLLMKPGVDTKGDTKVVSRIGIEAEVDAVIGADEMVIESMKAENGRPHAIVVDEAQFLTPSQVDELFIMSKRYDIPVLCYGLRTDFRAEGFPGATRLLELADDIEELKTVCSCGKKATHNLRQVNGVDTFNGDQVCIDNQDEVTYEAVCGECFLTRREIIPAKRR